MFIFSAPRKCGTGFICHMPVCRKAGPPMIITARRNRLRWVYGGSWGFQLDILKHELINLKHFHSPESFLLFKE